MSVDAPDTGALDKYFDLSKPPLSIEDVEAIGKLGDKLGINADPREFTRVVGEFAGDVAHTELVLDDVRREISRSIAKHGDQSHIPMGTANDAQPLLFCGDEQTAENLAQQATFWTDDRSFSQGDGTVTWRDILTEEVFEAYAESDPVKLRAELVQVAAVAVKMCLAVDVAASTVEAAA